MIRSQDFRRAIGAAFVKAGFTAETKSLRSISEAATLLVSLDKFEFGDQFFINVGFWLHDLGGEVPSKVESMHLYLRFERLFPEHREAILAGGNLDDASQPAALASLCDLVVAELGPRLRELTSSAAKIKSWYLAGGRNGGLIRKEAREYLANY